MNLFEYAEGERRRDEGIERVLSNNESYRVRFFEAADAILIKDGCVTSDGVVQVCGMPDGHPSAIGGAMRAYAMRRGLKKVGYVNSTRPSCHAAVVAVWG